MLADVRVNRRKRIVQKHHSRGPAVRHARERDAGLLAAAQVDAALANLTLDAAGQLLDVVGKGAALDDGVEALLVEFLAERDVVAQRGVDDPRHLRRQRGGARAARQRAADLVDLAEDGREQRRLTAPHGAHDADKVARANGERHFIQRHAHHTLRCLDVFLLLLLRLGLRRLRRLLRRLPHRDARRLGAGKLLRPGEERIRRLAREERRTFARGQGGVRLHRVDRRRRLVLVVADLEGLGRVYELRGVPGERRRVEPGDDSAEVAVEGLDVDLELGAVQKVCNALARDAVDQKVDEDKGQERQRQPEEGEERERGEGRRGVERLAHFLRVVRENDDGLDDGSPQHDDGEPDTDDVRLLPQHARLGVAQQKQLLPEGLLPREELDDAHAREDLVHQLGALVRAFQILLLQHQVRHEHAELQRDAHDHKGETDPHGLADEDVNKEEADDDLHGARDEDADEGEQLLHGDGVAAKEVDHLARRVLQLRRRRQRPERLLVQRQRRRRRHLAPRVHHLHVVPRAEERPERRGRVEHAHEDPQRRLFQPARVVGAVVVRLQLLEVRDEEAQREDGHELQHGLEEVEPNRLGEAPVAALDAAQLRREERRIRLLRLDGPLAHEALLDGSALAALARAADVGLGDVNAL
mmetsp:Transcript_31554/g.106263  ORF Transcript_31554/g.106263 Transcript_31554/m.106263 type:complete len:642 (+) Transcript_31554:945-2870(+)